MRFVFFGTPEIAVASLEALKERDLTPALIVTAPDTPKGRGLVTTSSPVRAWADAHAVPVATPDKLDVTFLSKIEALHPDVGVVVAYGKILPQALINLFPQGLLNMHPSLLPKHRGPSPIESQILYEQHAEDVGVSVMLLDAEMDHGPVLAQTSAIPDITAAWPMRASTLYPILADAGGQLLAETLPRWARGEMVAHDQEHGHATYCKKIQKEDAHLDLASDPETNYRKFLAYDMWPRVYFMHERGGKQMRVIVTNATLTDGAFVITSVLPEGKKEMPYAAFLRGTPATEVEPLG